MPDQNNNLSPIEEINGGSTPPPSPSPITPLVIPPPPPSAKATGGKPPPTPPTETGNMPPAAEDLLGPPPAETTSDKPSLGETAAPTQPPQAPPPAGKVEPSPLAPPPSAEATGGKPPTEIKPPKPPSPPLDSARGKPIKINPRIFKIIGIVLGITAVLAAIFYFLIYPAKINIRPTPAPDKITLDGKTVKPGNYRVKPGSHSVSIEKKGYVSYNKTKEFKINEKLDLNFELVLAQGGKLILAGAQQVNLTRDNRFLYILAKDGNIVSLPIAEIQTKATNPLQLSKDPDQGVRKILYSDDGTFSFTLDNEKIRFVDFFRDGYSVHTNDFGPTQGAWPENAKQVNSITWNTGSNQYFSTPNSYMIFDQKTDSGWLLYTTDRQHSQSKTQVIMRLDPKDFPSLYLDLSENPQYALLVGGSVWRLNIPSRTPEKISDKKNDFIWGQWGPKGIYALVVDKAGGVYKLENTTLTDLKIKTKPNLVVWLDQSNAIIISGTQPIKVNFDTQETIHYAEIKGIDSANSIALSKGVIYFTDSEGLKSANLTESVYGQ